MSDPAPRESGAGGTDFRENDRNPEPPPRLVSPVNAATRPSDRAFAADPPEEGSDLMLRVRDGDRDAFATIVGRYQKPVLNAVHQYVGNRAVAEEITQEVFVRVYGARSTYERRARFETWLFRIVFNLCANAAEYGRRRRTVPLPGKDGSPDSSPVVADARAGTPLEEAERRETRDRVREAVAALPDQQRAALVLSRFQDRSCQEIADTLDTTVDAVKSLLFRARENLRRALEPYLREEVRDERERV